MREARRRKPHHRQSPVVADRARTTQMADAAVEVARRCVAGVLTGERSGSGLRRVPVLVVSEVTDAASRLMRTMARPGRLRSAPSHP